MKIREQGINDPEPVTGTNEQLRFARKWREPARGGRRLKTANDRRADGNDSSAKRASFPDCLAHLVADVDPLQMHPVLLEVIHTNRLKRAGAHM